MKTSPSSLPAKQPPLVRSAAKCTAACAPHIGPSATAASPSETSEPIIASCRALTSRCAPLSIAGATNERSTTRSPSHDGSTVLAWVDVRGAAAPVVSEGVLATSYVRRGNATLVEARVVPEER